MPDTLFGDSVRIRQILINLISNARKFTEEGEISLNVELLGIEHSDVTRDTCCLLFSVSDTGIGITPEKQKKLFKAFTQADISTSRKFGGTGLGLAICKRLVEMMEGNIWVDSFWEEGSVFSFTIKLHVIEADGEIREREGELILSHSEA